MEIQTAENISGLEISAHFEFCKGLLFIKTQKLLPCLA
jgi:hypothetical protein